MCITEKPNLRASSKNQICVYLRKTKPVRQRGLGPQIHPLDFHSVRETYSLKTVVRSENAP